MKKYAVIIGNNREEFKQVVNALKKAGFDMLVRAEGNTNQILTINECTKGQVGAMLSNYSKRFSECEFEILFPEDVVLRADKLEGAKPKPIQMTVGEVCRALGKEIEIIAG